MIIDETMGVVSRQHTPPSCRVCGGQGLREHVVVSTQGKGYYLAERWVCKDCFARWVDDALARLNEWAA